jgi:hypothetical protein
MAKFKTIEELDELEIEGATLAYQYGLPYYIPPAEIIGNLYILLAKKEREIEDLRKQLSDEINRSIKHSQEMSSLMVLAALDGAFTSKTKPLIKKEIAKRAKERAE